MRPRSQIELAQYPRQGSVVPSPQQLLLLVLEVLLDIRDQIGAGQDEGR